METDPIKPELLQDHTAFLHRLATRLVWGDADADDLVQDTYLAALSGPPSRPGPTNGLNSLLPRVA